MADESGKAKLRSAARKAKNREEQEARHKANKSTPGPTPWERAKAARFKARTPKRLEWEKRHQSDILSAS